MPLFNPSKLEKLTVVGFEKADRKLPAGPPFEAMFNPESYKEKYSIRYEDDQGLDSGGKELRYQFSPPAELVLQLILDGTGVDTIGLESLAPRPAVSQRVQNFLKLAYRINGKLHEPNWLRITWGKHLRFDGRLLNAEIHYTSFDPSGSPLRATIDATFTTDDETDRRMKLENKKSPDLTHHRTVIEGDTLLLLTQRVYGSPDHYLWVAAANGLDHFRRLTPGQELVFPPLPISATREDA